MKQFDAIILGDGPAALSVADKYIQQGGNGNVILLNEIAPLVRGAYSKGVKSLNPIVTKLPLITEANIDNYKYITQRIKDAESAMAKIYKTTYAFQGMASIGYRCCNSKLEYDILCSLTGLSRGNDSTLDKSAAKFVSDSLGYTCEDLRLFGCHEKIWNTRGYLQIMAERIPRKFVQYVKDVNFCEENDGIVLQVTGVDGETEYIKSDQLIVCKGLGNINFEEQVRSIVSCPAKVFGFEVLDLAKFIHKSLLKMPEKISSIIVPKQKVCLTNEAPDRYSILYDTNAQLIPVNKYNPLDEANVLCSISEKLVKFNPAIPTTPYESFRCAMTLNHAAYTDKPNLHFEFLKSESVVENIHYLNLPYFTVVQAASVSLPTKLIDIK